PLFVLCSFLSFSFLFFFFNDTATPEIYTLSLHDALPICKDRRLVVDASALGDRAAQAITALFDATHGKAFADAGQIEELGRTGQDRKSTRLNSSHVKISYAVFCLKKKKKRMKKYNDKNNK